MAEQLRSYLDTVLRLPHVTPPLETFRWHLDKVSRSYWSGLFHCYDVPDLPRTNNALESHFRKTGRHLLRITGQRGQTQHTLQRQRFRLQSRSLRQTQAQFDQLRQQWQALQVTPTG